jgi:GTP pyrophosphokinase
MMRQYELVERVTEYDPGADEALLNKAYVYAMKAHGSQIRASGAPYFSHPLEVAAILTEHKLDDATIAAALLHDTVEDTDVTQAEIDKMFGGEIGALVDGLTKISQLDLMSREAAQAENLRKLLLAVAEDIRVLIVKLADRLHNMRTLEHVKSNKRTRIAQETMDIYAPLAGRMGMQEIRDELEELSFRILNPEAHDTITARLKVLRKESGDIIEEIETALTDKLREHGIEAVAKGREKRPYSIWNKMERRSISLGQLSDIYGFRMILDKLDDCYLALGVVHSTWRMVPGRFKDYISTPKQNDYRSIHTTVIGPHHKRVELQIRTREMHEVAERGVAAHALYKDISNGSSRPGPVPLSEDSNAYRWLRRLVDMLEEGDSPREFLEHTKLELFHDQVFCFTPKGHLITLPRGATPIDFAYAVHTDVGNSCVGCRINGAHAPLIGELENGDEVEIIRSKAQVPPASWEGLVVTGKARSAIRRATRDAVHEQYATLGREIIDRAVERAGADAPDEPALGLCADRLGFPDIDSFLAAIGRGEQRTADAIAILAPDGKAEPKTNKSAGRRWFSFEQFRQLKPSGRKTDGARAIPIRGLKSDLPVRIAQETGAVPGDRIVGILTPGEGITIYPIHSRALKAFEDQPDRWLDLTWDVDEEAGDRFPARIAVIMLNEAGTLAQIAQVIGDNDGNIANLNLVNRAEDFFEMHIDVEVEDLKHLNTILSKLKRKPVVSKVRRLNGA